MHSLESDMEPEVAEKGLSILFQDLRSGPLSPSSGANFK
jgi:hypothetical protein